MIPVKVASKFILVVIVENFRPKHGTLEIIYQPAGVGRVVANSADFDALKGIKEGDLMFFRPTDLLPVRLEAGVMHGFIFQEAVLGWVSADDAEGEEKHFGKLTPTILAPGRRNGG